MTNLPAEFVGKVSRLAPATRQHLDGLGPVELLARLLYVEHLEKTAATLTDASTFRGYSELASRVLAAPPRAEVARRVSELRKTALAMPATTMRTSANGAAAALERDNPTVPEEYFERARVRIAAENARPRPAVAPARTRTGARPAGKATGAQPTDMIFKQGRAGR
ncbi:hypothetical protein Dvina_01475 [Dactylosporangium vinaceum]|uniref:Uncharacterized protein n=1 Tax=Dactylosporangium vinaceum TaxID=53362 RepID=A0ABV5MLP7_9ACTN|nr:hypothetical protein [Dactylosporangium vinaceum]UAB96929.1 hypothetical protein Dvina_01475 [Dactylosporangium vinaceum]